MAMHYQPVENGYQIMGSRELFNRGLYGGHGHDDHNERYFTLAGDQPLIMGCVTDWCARPDCTHAKAGVLMLGVAHTPGLQVPQFCYTGQNEDDGDRTSQWFHHSEGTVSTYRNGWMEYDLQPFFQCFPQVKAHVEVLPLQEADGFLVALDVWTDQRTFLCIGFGGVTGFLGRLEFPIVQARNFRVEDCQDTVITTGVNRARVRGRHTDELAADLWVGTSFTSEVSAAPAAAALAHGPGLFMAPNADGGEAPMARLTCAIEPHRRLRGHIVVLRNEPVAVLDDWLSRPNAAEQTKRAIRAKHEMIEVQTPDEMLNLTVPSTVIALDATWHGKSFHHGTYAWHTPYLGWRNWYGPTVLGWHNRVDSAFRTHAANRVTESDGPETVTYHGPGQYSLLTNSHGFIPELPDRRTLSYNMQEVGVDMFLHHLEWTGDLSAAAELFEAISGVLEWEARLLDPDHDGLYQNWLNTWISDAHSYNGGGCAQSSAYNYRANRTMAWLAEALGRDAAPFRERAKRIQQAVKSILWQPGKGVVAEYVDTVGNCLIHDSPELGTIYHTIAADIVDKWQAYRMLRFTETGLRNERTLARGGRLVWSSNWWPHNYSSCGLYTCENLHLAWGYFRCGDAARGMDILTAVVDAHFMSSNPGMAAHCMAGSGYTSGSQDFSEISSMHLRTIVEGLFGVRLDLLKRTMEVAPNVPTEWAFARLRVPDIRVDIKRQGREDRITLSTPHDAALRLAWPLRAKTVDAVLLNGAPVAYELLDDVGVCRLVVDLPAPGQSEIMIRHGDASLPQLQAPDRLRQGERLIIDVDGGKIGEVRDEAGTCTDVTRTPHRLTAGVVGKPGHHTLFVKVTAKQFSAWIPVDFEVMPPPVPEPPTRGGAVFEPLAMDPLFNCELTAIHQQEYRQPRPEGYSIGMRLNGRFGWDWNHGGHLGTLVNDRTLREAGGIYTTPNGISFATPPSGPNVACASIWENFPTEVIVPLLGSGKELAVLFVAATNPMQAAIENARFIVTYDDGSSMSKALVHTRNLDDWLNPAVQIANETVCFSTVNHGIVQRLRLDAARPLRSLTVRAVANEVIIGILGVSLRCL